MRIPNRRLEQASQDRIISVLTEADRAWNDESRSDDVDDLLAKTALEKGLPVRHVPILVYGWNTAQQNAQRLSGRKVLDKFASFPLADPSRVASRMFPDLDKSSFSVDPRWSFQAWAPPSGTEKAAFLRREESSPLRSGFGRPESVWASRPAEPLSDPRTFWRLEEERLDAAEKKASESRYRAAVEEDRLRRAYARLRAYYEGPPKQADLFVPPFELRESVRARHGSEFVPILDLVFEEAGLSKEARADLPSRNLIRFDVSAAPFRDAEELVDSLRSFAVKRADCVDSYRSAEEARKRWRGLLSGALDPDRPRPDDAGRRIDLLTGLPGEDDEDAELPKAPAADGSARSVDGGLEEFRPRAKQAGVVPFVLGATLSDLARRYLPTSKTVEEMQNKVNRKLDSWDQLSEIRSARAKTVLADLLANDEVIRGFDPEEVVAAYNEISQMAPQISLRESALRPVLRRALSGGTEPFEIRDLLSTEQMLQTPDQKFPQDTAGDFYRPVPTQPVLNVNSKR